jgi:hypothetical protein
MIFQYLTTFIRLYLFWSPRSNHKNDINSRMRSGRARKITDATLMVTGFALSLANELWLLRHGGILTRSTPGAWLLGLSWLLIPGGLTSSGGDVSMLQRLTLEGSSPTLTHMCCTYDLFVPTHQPWDTYC